MKQRRLKIEFSSDWYIGSGAGIPGSIDRHVIRDVNGLPYVPGKTLTGVLRDAAELVADIRHEHDRAHGWREVLTSLFGEQPDTHRRSDLRGGELTEARGAAIGVSSAELSDSVRSVLNDKGYERLGLKAALFSARAGVKIDRVTGRSEDKKLFSTERTRRDCELTASVTALRELSDDETALFDDAVKAVRRIGGSRRRGAGSCTLKWLGDWHEAACGDVEGCADLFAGDGDVVLSVHLKTLQPLIINRVTLGNEVKSDSVVPGTSLLPYFANDVFGAIDRGFMRRCVTKGDISIGTLLPEFGNEPSLTVPLCIAEVKDQKVKVNRMVPSDYDDRSVQLKDIRSGFITVEDGVMMHHGTAGSKVVRTHNTIDDDVQRPTSGVGGLFTYEAIGAGSSFRGELRIAKALADKIRELPEGERSRIARMLAHDVHSFGRSRKDEYGSCELHSSVADASDQWNSYELRDGSNGRKYLVVLLRSELLMRGANGAWSVSLDDLRKLLEDRLDVSLSDDPSDRDDDGKVSPIGGTRGHSIRIDRRESWHSGWALPRPSLLCFKAGSIFMFKVTEPEKWDEERARRLVREGLGERRAEGYGQLLIDPPFLFKSEVRTGAEQISDDRGCDAAVALDDPFVKDLAETALMRRFRRAARREAYAVVASDPESTPFENFAKVVWKDKPKNSQFGALREAAASIEATGDTKIFADWAGTLSKRDKGKDRWKEKWKAMLEEMAARPELIWDMRSELRKLKDEFSSILSVDKDPAKFMGIFFDQLCEAIFDNEKGNCNERGGEPR